MCKHRERLLTRICLAALFFAAAPCIALSAPGEPIAPTAGSADKNVSKALSAKLQPFVDEHSLAGAVMLVASKDKVLSVQTVGFADIGGKKPMQRDTLFWIASQSKAITAAGLMMLVDEGKVKVDDPVEKYLPEFKSQMVAVEQDKDHELLKPPAHPITVKEVLSHTSGLPFMPRVEHKIDEVSLRGVVYCDALTPLQSEPGTKYLYSNAGIDTAGRIIEVVAGMPYEKFLQERLFTPLGMKDSTFVPNDEQLKRLAKTYKPNAAKAGLEETPISYLTYPLSNKERTPAPGGGLFSTAADVSQFCRMILGDGELAGRRYLSEASVKQMTTNQIGDIPIKDKTDTGYGFGWQVERKINGQPAPANTAFSHGGADGTSMTVDPEHQLVIVFMVQHAGYPHDAAPKIHSAFKEAVFEAFGK